MKTKFIFGLVLIVLVLAGFGYLTFSSKRPTESITHTTTLTSASMSIPEISVTYSISILDRASGQIHVKGVLDNLKEEYVVLGRGETGGDRKVPPMTNFSPEYVSVSQSQRFIEVVTLDIGDKSRLEFEYDVNLSPEASVRRHSWHLDSRFASVEPEYLLLFPTTSAGLDYLWIENVTVSFEIPDGWEVLTHWHRDGDHFHVYSTNEFMYGFLGFGKFERVTREIGGMQVTVAFNGISYTQREYLSEMTFSLYEYYTTNVGRIIDSTRVPRTQYIVLFVAGPDSRPVLSNKESAYGYFTSFDEDEHLQAHRIFHEWNAGAFHGDMFLREGLTTYFEYHAVLDTGIWTRDKYNKGLIWEYREYQNNFMGTASDVQLDPSRSDIDRDFYYWKGAIVGYLLNEMIARVTDGKCDMVDVMRYLFDHYATREETSLETRSSSYFVSSASLLEALNTVTGHDFSPVFEAYVFGTDHLPVSIQGRELVIDYEKLPDTPKIPEDSDRDGLTDDEEILYGTSIENRDTDNDGLTDGEETHGYRVIWIDGVADDWRGIDPLWVDARNDCQNSILHSDLKLLSIYFDGNNLFFVIELYDGKPNLDDSYDLMFDLNGDHHPDYTFNCYPEGRINMWNVTSNGQYAESNLVENPPGIDISSDEVVEIRIPLELIGGSRSFGLASQIFVSTIQAENDYFVPRWIDVSLDESFHHWITDPLNPDTDGDGSNDGDDTQPLDPNL